MPDHELIVTEAKMSSSREALISMMTSNGSFEKCNSSSTFDAFYSETALPTSPTTMDESSRYAFAGISTNRPSRETILQRLSEALLRRSLTKIDLSQRCLLPLDARLVKMALLQNSKLSVLKLGYNNLCDEGVSILAAGVAEHKALALLDLGFNNFGDEGCMALAEAITSTSNIHTLYLAGNLIGPDGALALADTIRRGCKLNKLYLTGNRIGPDGVQAIAESIEEDENRRICEQQPLDKHDMLSNVEGIKTIVGGVRELFLGGTGMQLDGCRAVSRLLAQSQSLRVLSLSNCDFGDEAVSMLAASIKENRGRLSLETLQLSFNRISHKGIEQLTNAVWGMQSLRELLLDNNEFGDRGSQQIASVLPYLQRLEVLNVGFNQIKASGIKVLMKAVTESRVLQSLSLSGNAVDTSAAKSISYALALNRSLISLSLVHCAVSVEAKRHIAAGMVSNNRISLRDMSGFNLGPIIVTLGFPPVLEHWSNEQIMNFVHLMWKKYNEDSRELEEEKVVDPLQFLPSSFATMDKFTPLDASVVVEVAKQAFASLVADGVDIFSRQPNHSSNGSATPPIHSETVVYETVCNMSSGQQKQSNSARYINSKSFVAPPESNKAAAPDPTRKKRVVEWLCSNIQQLNKIAQQPFSSADLWRLHQHYFTPVVNESGGSVSPSLDSSSLNNPPRLFVSSVPEVSRSDSNDNPVDTMSDSTDGNITVPVSEPIIKEPQPQTTSFPLMKRKVSYRFLGDAAPMSLRDTSQSVNDSKKLIFNSTKATSISVLIESGPTGHSMPPKNKRARRNRSRLSFLPRIKVKLDSYLDVCHEKALTTMRQLYYVEQAILSGKVNSVNPAAYSQTHLCGDNAIDAEMIIVDMI